MVEDMEGETRDREEMVEIASSEKASFGKCSITSQQMSSSDILCHLLSFNFR